MNSAGNTATSVGIGAAIIVIINAWLNRFHLPLLSPEEAAAYITVITALAGYYLHMRTTTNAGLFLTGATPLQPK